MGSVTELVGSKWIPQIGEKCGQRREHHGLVVAGGAKARAGHAFGAHDRLCRSDEGMHSSSLRVRHDMAPILAEVRARDTQHGRCALRECS